MSDDKEKPEGSFVEKKPNAAEVATDLDGVPRLGEDFKLGINGEEYDLVPAPLRDIPKLGTIIKEITTPDEESSDDLSMFDESKVNLIAELIHLSLSKENRKKVTIDDILDNCSFGDFPMAIQAVLNLNDFLARMGQVRLMTDAMI